jgi:hypothetical protein
VAKLLKVEVVPLTLKHANHTPIFRRGILFLPLVGIYRVSMSFMLFAVTVTKKTNKKVKRSVEFPQCLLVHAFYSGSVLNPELLVFALDPVIIYKNMCVKETMVRNALHWGSCGPRVQSCGSLKVVHHLTYFRYD